MMIWPILIVAQLAFVGWLLHTLNNVENL